MKTNTGIIELTLPMPPSVNALFATNFSTKRRFKSKVYGEWEQMADLAMSQCSKFTITGDSWLLVRYSYYFPILNADKSKKKKDTENYAKAISDFLSTRISGFEDHKIKRLELEKFESKENVVRIEIIELT